LAQQVEAGLASLRVVEAIEQALALKSIATTYPARLATCASLAAAKAPV
jgi:hypothetical protein